MLLRICLVLGLLSVALAAPSWKLVETVNEYVGRGETSFARCGDEKLCLVGGRGENRVSILDTKALVWSPGKTGPFQMHHFQAVYGPDDCVWIAGAWTGGFPDEDTVNNIWAYCRADDTWEKRTSISRPRGAGGAVFYEGKLYLVSGNVGGHNPSAKVVPWFDCYDPETGEWTELPDVPNPRDHFHTVVIGSKLYVAGGRLSTFDIPELFTTGVDKVDVYDFETGEWSALPDLPRPRGGVAATEYDSTVMLLGGESGRPSAWTEVDILRDGKFVPFEDMPDPRHGTGAVSCNGAVWIAGGVRVQGGGDASVETYAFFDGDTPPVCTDSSGGGTAPPTSTSPSTSTTSPGTSTSSTGTSATTPGTPTDAPGTPTDAPGTPTDAPNTSTTAPGTPTTAPSTPTTTPGTPTTAPSTSTTAPGTSTTKPEASSTKPSPTGSPASSNDDDNDDGTSTVDNDDPPGENDDTPGENDNTTTGENGDTSGGNGDTSSGEDEGPSSDNNDSSSTNNTDTSSDNDNDNASGENDDSSSNATGDDSDTSADATPNPSEQDEAGSNSDPVCFPSDATVQLESGSIVRMDELRIGDRVKVAHPDEYSEVYFFSHRHPHVSSKSIMIETSVDGVSLTLSPGHMVYANGSPVCASAVKVGDVVSISHERYTQAKVTKISGAVTRGLHNPHTFHGDIIVNRVVASTYTSTVHPSIAQVLLFPFKAAYTAFGATATVESLNRIVLRALDITFWRR